MINGIIDSGQKIVTNGLVLHLDAAQLRSYPTTGTTWTDLSGNGNNGTLINGPTFNSGNGGSIVFDGVNDSVQRNTPSFSRNNGEEITVSTWIRPGKLSGSYQDIITNRLNESYNWIFYQHITDGALAFHGTAQNKSNYIPTLNNWINVTVTVNSSQILLMYVNSSIQFTKNNYQYGPNNETQLWIGNAIFRGNPEPYLGRVATVSIYYRALSATEVLQNYNATKSRFGL